MPKFLEDALKREYPNNPGAVYGTMNKIGAMHGNKETAKGRAMETKHNADVKAGNVSMPKAAFVREHQRLTKVLKSGTRAERTQEAEKQSSELTGRERMPASHDLHGHMRYR